jgi:hypothetical protein
MLRVVINSSKGGSAMQSTPTKFRLHLLASATAAATLALSGQAAADSTIKFAPEQAACIAQAWVPANTDPESEPGVLGAFISDEARRINFGQEIRQDQCPEE